MYSLHLQIFGCSMDSLHAGYFFMFLLSSADFFQNKLFQKVLPGSLSVSNGLDPDQDNPDLRTDKTFNLIWSKLFAKIVSRRQ